MGTNNSERRYEVLSPWADADRVPARGLAIPRLTDLNGKKIGLFQGIKKASGPILRAVERGLTERYPKAEFRWYKASALSAAQLEPQNTDKFKEWIRGVDAAILAVAD